jgi:hypothetical protein
MGGLVLVDILALRFGYDSRTLLEPRDLMGSDPPRRDL